MVTDLHADAELDADGFLPIPLGIATQNLGGFSLSIDILDLLFGFKMFTQQELDFLPGTPRVTLDLGPLGMETFNLGETIDIDIPVDFDMDSVEITPTFAIDGVLENNTTIAAGEFDDVTQSALRNFQSEAGLPVSGVPDQLTLWRLVRPGDRQAGAVRQPSLCRTTVRSANTAGATSAAVNGSGTARGVPLTASLSDWLLPFTQLSPPSKDTTDPGVMLPGPTSPAPATAPRHCSAPPKADACTSDTQ